MSQVSLATSWVFASLALLLTGCQVEKDAGRDSSPMSDAEAKAFSNLHGCNACHAVDELRLGPSFRAVSQMYDDKSQKTVERLALKIRNGGAGSWGNVPMVARPQLSESEAERIARWIIDIPTDVDKAAVGGGAGRSSVAGQ